MHTTPRRRVLSRLMTAAAFGLYAAPAHYAEGGQGEGGTTSNAGDKGKGEGTSPPPPASPKKVELTEDELQARISAAAEAERKKFEQKAEKDRQERERKAAEEKGEWEKVAQQEKAAREKADADLAALRLESKGRQVDVMLRDHLAEKHPEYAAVAKYIRPLVQFDAGTTEETLSKRIAEAAEAYVRDNPRSGGRGGGAPASNPYGRASGGQNANNGGQHRPNVPAATGVAASRF